MPRHDAKGQHWDDDNSDDDWDVDETDDGEDEPTIACPYCGVSIHEDTVRCPHCEQYISSVDSPPARKPWWILLGVALCLYAIYRWILG